MRWAYLTCRSIDFTTSQTLMIPLSAKPGNRADETARNDLHEDSSS